MRAGLLLAALVVALPVMVAAGVETAATDSLAVRIPEDELRFAAVETAFAAALADACSQSAGDDLRCIEAKTLAEVAEELLQEGEGALAVELLEEALALLGTRGG